MQIAIDGREHTWEIDEERFARLCEPLCSACYADRARDARRELQPAR